MPIRSTVCNKKQKAIVNDTFLRPEDRKQDLLTGQLNRDVQGYYRKCSPMPVDAKDPTSKTSHDEAMCMRCGEMQSVPSLFT